MLLNEFRQHFYDQLIPLYGREETQAFFYELAAFYLSIKKHELVFNLDVLLTNAQHQHLDQALQRLIQHEPIQYIIGFSEFMGLSIQVTPEVLIPRPETEELVLWILEDLKQIEKPTIRILDIGTGSGCIAIALAKQLPQAEVYALDISKKALEVAQKNAQLHGVEIQFLDVNVLEVSTLNKKFDIIVSNPPYVTPSEKSAMQANVLNYEPHTALFVPEDQPLLFYDAICRLAISDLASGGQLYLEINEAYGPPLIELLTRYNYTSYYLKKDLYGKDRMVKASRSM